MCVTMFIWKYVCEFAYVSVYVYLSKYVYWYDFSYSDLRMFRQMDLYMSWHVCVWICMYKCVFIYIYIYVCLTGTTSKRNCNIGENAQTRPWFVIGVFLYVCGVYCVWCRPFSSCNLLPTHVHGQNKSQHTLWRTRP